LAQRQVLRQQLLPHVARRRDHLDVNRKLGSLGAGGVLSHQLLPRDGLRQNATQLRRPMRFDRRFVPQCACHPRATNSHALNETLTGTTDC
jgi:hypothetical protein